MEQHSTEKSLVTSSSKMTDRHVGQINFMLDYILESDMKYGETSKEEILYNLIYKRYHATQYIEGDK